MKTFTVIVELRIDAETDVQAANKVADAISYLNKEFKMVTGEEENLFQILAKGY